MKYAILFFLFLLPVLGFAQQPKLHLKFFGGTNSNQFLYRVDTIDFNFLSGYQYGFGFRVSRRRLFGEVNASFTRFGATFISTEAGGQEEEVNARINYFEVPLNVGYIPVKTPFFKWYLYGGLVNRFSGRGIINFGGEKTKYKPGELGLPAYNLDVQVGTQFDIAMLNFDFHYKIITNNSWRENKQPNLNPLYLSAGFIF